MRVDLKPGKYVVAVSGGVDSVALLDVLAKKRKAVSIKRIASKSKFQLPNSNFQFVVAHYDHGIRADSVKDRKLVESLAKKHGLPFEFAEGRLGPNASEATARAKRYEFLRNVKFKHHAQAIITAHHQDDLLETAIINLMRGTGRRGLSSLKSTNELKRPLLNFTKPELINYATRNHLTWREDGTNSDESYLRNWLRRQIIPKLSVAQRASLLQNIQQASSANQSIDRLIDGLLNSKLDGQGLDRAWFNHLPHTVAKEIMVAWLRQNELQFDRRRIERLVIAAKTYPPGKATDINKAAVLKVGNHHLALVGRER